MTWKATRPGRQERSRSTSVECVNSSITAGRLAARGASLKGDDQADREAHGGPDKAIYVYAIEDTNSWGKADWSLADLR